MRVEIPVTGKPEELLHVGDLAWEESARQIVFYPDRGAWFDEADLKAVLALLEEANLGNEHPILPEDAER